MTSRGAMIVLVSALLVAFGWVNHWPELCALGGAGIAAVVIVLAVIGTPAQGTIEVDQAPQRVVRGQAATVRLKVSSSRPRYALRLVEGAPADPKGSLLIGRDHLASGTQFRFPIDTSRRGQRPMGPFHLVQGDQWSIVRRTVSRAEGGIITVQPRVFPVRAALVSRRIVPDSEMADRRLGDVHFHALRDYVLGDEPRMVHWRSSARAGHLVVRQNLAPTSTGTCVVLDTDISAYGADSQFGSSWLPERFEITVEVAASIVASLPKSSGQVYLTTTATGSSPTSAPAGVTNALLDRLAVVDVNPPLEVVPEQLVSLVRSTHCSRLIVVTGTPSRTLPLAVSAAARIVPATVVIRVGATKTPDLAGLRVIDVESAEALL